MSYDAEQESEELSDEVIARLNPQTGAVENVEVLFFSTRLLRSDLFELPVTLPDSVQRGQTPAAQKPIRDDRRGRRRRPL